MRGRWNLFELQLYKVLWVVKMLHLHGDECPSLNLEGLALLEFRSKVQVDLYGDLDNWDPLHCDPCNWSGVHCIDGSSSKGATLHIAMERNMSLPYQEAHNLPAAALKGAVPQEAIDIPSTGSGRDLLAASIQQRNVPPASISPHPKGTPPKESNTEDNDSAPSGMMRKRAFVLVLPGFVLLLLLEAFSCATGRQGKKWLLGRLD